MSFFRADPENAPKSVIVALAVRLGGYLAAAMPGSGFGGDLHPAGGACCCRGLAAENRLLSVKTCLVMAGTLPAAAVAGFKNGKNCDSSWCLFRRGRARGVGRVPVSQNGWSRALPSLWAADSCKRAPI